MGWPCDTPMTPARDLWNKYESGTCPDRASRRSVPRRGSKRVSVHSPPPARVARGGEGSGVGGLSARTTRSESAEPPPTPDHSPPLRGGRGEDGDEFRI